MSIGRFASRSLAAQGCEPLANSLKHSPPWPNISSGNVRSRAGPIAAIWKPPRRNRLRSRALTSGASQRGLVPMSRQASAFSMPATVVLKRYPARQRGVELNRPQRQVGFAANSVKSSLGRTSCHEVAYVAAMRSGPLRRSTTIQSLAPIARSCPSRRMWADRETVREPRRLNGPIGIHSSPPLRCGGTRTQATEIDPDIAADASRHQ